MGKDYLNELDDELNQPGGLTGALDRRGQNSRCFKGNGTACAKIYGIAGSRNSA
jgi:hypothetical protein